MRKTFPLPAFCLCFVLSASLQAQWVKTDGLPGGNIFYFFEYGDTVLAKVGSLLYYSSNEGQSWSEVTPSFQGELSLGATDGKDILVSRFPTEPQLTNLFRTDDFFQTLHPIALSDTVSVAQAFFANGYTYFSDNHNLYRTNDDGSSWEKIPVPYHYQKIWAEGQRLTMAIPKNLVQSTDGGFTWDTLLQFQGNVIQVLQHENQIYIFIQDAANGCYFSDDYGQSWQHYTGTGFDQVYGFEWHKGSIYGFDAEKLIKTSDFGQTWSDIILPPSYYSSFFTGISIGNTLLVGGPQSISSAVAHRSTDEAVTWEPAATGIAAGTGYLRPIEGELYVPSSAGLFKLLPDGTNWEKQDLNFSPPTFYPARISDFTKSGGNWLIIDRGDVWVSTDGGNSWLESSDLSSYLETFIPAGENVIARGSSFAPGFSHYSISTDHGLSFKSIQSLQQQFQTQILALDVDHGQIFAFALDKKIYRSGDGGDTWALHSIPSAADSLGGILVGAGVEIFVRDSFILVFAQYPSKMIVSQDAGNTWEYLPPGPTGFPWGMRPINELLRLGNRLVAATENGFFISKNNGTDWEEWNESFPYRYVWDLEAHDGYLWAAADGAGIWKRPLEQVGVENIPNIPASISNLGLSPNPTTHLVQVSTDGEAGEISVLDGTGRVMLRQSVGKTETQISVAGFPQGLYQVVFRGEKSTRCAWLAVQR